MTEMKKNKLILLIAILAVGTAAVYAFATGSTETETAPVQISETVASINAAQQSLKGKILIAYFTSPETDGVDAVAGASRVIVNEKFYSNTQYIAELIQEATGADIFEIKTVKAYPGTHKELVDYAKVENENKARPRLSTHIDNLADYDIVFIGFPNWWYDMPMPMYSFFEEYDFTGKTIIPFNTHGGSRFSSAIKTITELEKGATVIKKGLPISRESVDKAKPTVIKWLSDIGITK